MSDIKFDIGLPPNETVEYFRAKGTYPISNRWWEVWQEEHVRAFTVARITDRTVLEQVRRSLDVAMAEGRTFAQWKDEVLPDLRASVAAGTAPTRILTDARLRVIYSTNLRMARAAGQWTRIERAKSSVPFLMYNAVRDGRTRPSHKRWDGTVLPVDHPWWDTHYPPCGWNCRCDVIPLSQADLDDQGLTINAPPKDGPDFDYERPDGVIETVPAGIDPGFAYNPGKAHMRGLVPPPAARPPATRSSATGTPPLATPLNTRPPAADSPTREAPPPGAVTTDAPRGVDPATRLSPSPPPPPSTPAPALSGDPTMAARIIERARIEPVIAPPGTRLPKAPPRTLPDLSILPPLTTADDALAAWRTAIGQRPGMPVLLGDGIGEPLVIDDAFWLGPDDALTITFDGRHRIVILIAETLKEPDEVWSAWEAVGTGPARIRRTYLARFRVGDRDRSIAVIVAIGAAGWMVETIMGDDETAYDERRAGVLQYCRR